MTHPYRPKVLRCIECSGTNIIIVGGDAIYPHRPDLHGKRFHRCQCGAYCGSHADTGVALGYPCGPATRWARQAAHAALDPVWRQGTLKRNGAYRRLARELGLNPAECHIGMMNETTARRVPAAVERILKRGGTAT